jgi:hypothetical protein
MEINAGSEPGGLPFASAIAGKASGTVTQTVNKILGIAVLNVFISSSSLGDNKKAACP